MRKHLFTLSLLAALAFCSFASAHAQTELVNNGGFETGDLTGWTGGTSDAVITSDPNYVHSGTHGLGYGAVGGTTPLYQDLTTIIGNTEVISFWEHQFNNTANKIEVSFDGVVLFDGVDLADGAWTLHTFTVTATSTTSRLQFDLRQDSGLGGLDDISVLQSSSSVTPEGDSLFLISSGLLPILGVGLWRRRRNRQA